MPTPPIPLETIEHSIGFLRGDIPSLAACSLTCHALLPISRVQLWHEVVLPVQSDGSHSSRTETFIGVLNRNPAIAPYVRSLVLHPRESPGIQNVFFNRTALVTLSARLPAFRSLRLRRLAMESLYEVVTLIRDLPHLETLDLDTVSLARMGLPAEWPQERVTPTGGAGDGPPPVWALRTLSLFGGAIHGGEIARLADFLERAREFLPGLNSVDFGCPMLPSGAGGAAVAPGIPSFGPSLRHFGTIFCDIEDDMSLSVEGREHVERVISGLRRCGSLRSLHLQYDRRMPYLGSLLREKAFGTPQPFTPTPFFLEHLADVLSTPGPAPLPLLESILLVFYGPNSWLVGFEAAFARLADALVGDADGSTRARGVTEARRYPRFSYLHVHTSFLGMLKMVSREGDPKVQEQRERQEAERVGLVVPMLAKFVRAGVRVEVTCD
ncbi:uncharacterized protein TRAVEDRAFT_48002 [Trametes versicolor FP-101664 SS1]|uniref:uncharacterized protein n=1 Tax=Trametes versicolor (strain FP-101664) TaxID=717944 RepID=UPI0004622774|nr:uncharacterized protein TRAVEDRAFT_48002 [Trametes versicolor FP-101664 SS1]EIW58860.1 hypothetical protein TRAVEDRAFT_48002 [Trametes versicolor FP-101664 SS1]